MSADDPTLLLPDGDGPHPGVVLGAEAYGVNEFIVEVGEQLAAAGYAVLIPDYYRGDGPKNREAYDDFDEVVELHRASRLHPRRPGCSVDGIDQLRTTPGVDPSRGSRSGDTAPAATIAWLAACQRDVAAAVLFFPSQPRFRSAGAEHAGAPGRPPLDARAPRP